jgi:hypothetical protein
VLPFKLHSLSIGGKHYLLLPKLNAKQMKIIAERLVRKGFSVDLASMLQAKSRGHSIVVDPAGLCWSSMDPDDTIIPAIPDLLSCPKQSIPLRDLEGLYLRRGTSFAKMRTRLESGCHWDSLRANDESGLTPDERSVVLALLKSMATCRLMTDFVREGQTPQIFGRRRYFETSVDFEEAASTLRTAGERHHRNSYLPRDGIFGFSRGESPRAFGRTLPELGEWCFYTPTGAKALIADIVGPTQPR